MKKNNLLLLLIASIILLIPTKIFATEKYNITFYANGGFYQNSETEYKIEIEKFENLENIEYPHKTGYQFIGYYTENNILLDDYFNNKENSKSVIFYAKWEQIELEKAQPKKVIVIISATLVLIGYVYIVIFNKKDD